MCDGDPDVYVQGFFRLGTAIKPASDAEDHDIDMVCCLDYEKFALTQAELKRCVGVEIKAYAKRYNRSAPEDGRRCWTLVYADGTRFHMDILPSLPDAKNRHYLTEAGPALARLGATALAITDKEHPHFRGLAGEWQRSNPKGYALWFRDRMGRVFSKRARYEAQRMRASIENVPAYRVRTHGTFRRARVADRHRPRSVARTRREPPPAGNASAGRRPSRSRRPPASRNQAGSPHQGPAKNLGVRR